MTAGGFGAGDFRAGDPRFAGDDLGRNLELVSVLAELSAEHRTTPGRLALAWLLGQGPDVVPIPGSRRPERVVENAGAAGLHLTAADLARIEDALPRRAWSGDRRSFAAHGTARRG